GGADAVRGLRDRQGHHGGGLARVVALLRRHVPGPPDRHVRPRAIAVAAQPGQVLRAGFRYSRPILEGGTVGAGWTFLPLPEGGSPWRARTTSSMLTAMCSNRWTSGTSTSIPSIASGRPASSWTPTARSACSWRIGCLAARRASG